MQNGGRKAGPSGSRWVGAGPSGPFRVVWATVLFILVGMWKWNVFTKEKLLRFLGLLFSSTGPYASEKVLVWGHQNP